MVGSLGITCFGSVQHALGVASLTSGHLDQAIDHLRAAVQHNLALAHWPAVVASRRRLAQAYQRRGQAGDAEAARGELETAASEAAALGLPVPDQDAREPASLVADCHRVGRKWRLAWRDRSLLMEDSIGMTHLAVLVANPRQEILAAELAAGLSALGTAGEGGSAYPVLDQAAITEYRNRLKRLDAELDQREPGDEREPGDTEARAERTGWSLSWLARRGSGAASGLSPIRASALASPSARPSAAPWSGSPRQTRSSATICGRPCTPASAAPTGRLISARRRTNPRVPEPRIRTASRRTRRAGGIRPRTGRARGPGRAGRRRPPAARRLPGPARGGRPRPAAG